jgi:hypothetical protein
MPCLKDGFFSLTDSTFDTDGRLSFSMLTASTIGVNRNEIKDPTVTTPHDGIDQRALWTSNLLTTRDAAQCSREILRQRTGQTVH